MIGLLLGPIAEVAKTWIGGKVAVSKANADAALETTKAKAEVMKRVAAGELDWNQTMAEASNTSWKDEWLTILVSIPLILAFTGNEDVVTRGFAALETMPDFYKTAVGVVFAASFGVQQLTKMFKK
tara:strand:+ start:160 stop:537 length:378 start_codon:yes stop_codon:yes gene_type:complete